MKHFNEFIIESLSSDNISKYDNKTPTEIAESFIHEMEDFVKKELSKLPGFDGENINDEENSLCIKFESPNDKFKDYEINIYGIDTKDNYGDEFEYLSNRKKNVFFIIFYESDLNSSGSSDELYEFIKKKNKKLAKSLPDYKGFECGGWDEGFLTYYSIANEEIVNYLKECLIEYCKNIK